MGICKDTDTKTCGITRAATRGVLFSCAIAAAAEPYQNELV
jgi:hypothetical protein